MKRGHAATGPANDPIRSEWRALVSPWRLTKSDIFRLLNLKPLLQVNLGHSDRPNSVFERASGDADFFDVVEKLGRGSLRRLTAGFDSADFSRNTTLRSF